MGTTNEISYEETKNGLKVAFDANQIHQNQEIRELTDYKLENAGSELNVSQK